MYRCRKILSYLGFDLTGSSASAPLRGYQIAQTNRPWS